MSFGVALIGTGFIGPIHLEALRRAGQQVVGILGSSPARSQSAAEKYGIPRGYASLDELLYDPRVQAVHVTSPNRYHAEQTAAALRAGKHVLCEKPLAMTSQESADLVKLAAETGLHAGVCYNVRFYPLCHEARARVLAGEAGKLLHVTGSYVQDWLLHETDFNWRVLASEGGPLRAIADIGTHWLDLIQFIMAEEVTSVCADLQTVHPIRKRPRGMTSVETFQADRATPVHDEEVSIDTEDAGNILLQFASGAKGNLHVSQTTAGRKNCIRYELAGRSESLAWNSERPNELWIGQRDRASELLVRDPALLSPLARGIAAYPGGHNEGFSDSFKQLFRSFYGSLDKPATSAAQPYPTLAEGHREILLCEAILRSHASRGWVEV
ncbi:1,5-anhydro-D-fructose reductase [Anatilimnocola aggregata]|uniref:1,5-anhydro-D-fructose reductase n=1 Tax=Anatilimnocola aggregata TaxID=2528021 RepID=A0A517Y5F6_9BACT|nr:Gfo/Idh/MocA family oxidoreductase [Anatilimnocola aggregata]QDU25465.1 1,5-anhydro-D-fructose reductase [Anatilimnocola aggregata]